VEALRLNRDIKTEVLVVGAGITGAMVAQMLAADGFKVVIVDRRGPAKGSTLASTALVQFEIDTPLTQLKRKIGAANAERAWRRSRLAVDALAGTLGQLGVRDVATRDTLYLAGNMLDPAGLKREAAARQSAGIQSEYMTQGEIAATYGLKARAALRSHGNIAIDPRQATLALLADALQHKARLYCPADITDVSATARTVRAATKGGPEITAKHLVFATGYEMPKYVPQRGHQVVSTWAIATPPQRARLWPSEAMIWEAADPYLYVRTTREGRVICGGEDEEFSDEEKRDALIARKSATLARKLKKLAPALDTSIEFEWTGSFGQSVTGLPSIGEIPGMPNCWAALGYGGNGTTYSRMAAEIIRNALHGRADRDADLYDFPRH
jgi:glycine/D-amino acid oxidase-like deaminating enzyme